MAKVEDNSNFTDKPDWSLVGKGLREQINVSHNIDICKKLTLEEFVAAINNDIEYYNDNDEG